MATIRGTTPTITFNLPFDVSEIRKCEVYFAQNDTLLLTKETSDCTLDGRTLSVTLTQEDTLRFEDDAKIEMQIRFVFTSGSVDATQIVKGKIGRILKDGEIDVD